MERRKRCPSSPRTKSPTRSSIAWRSCYVSDPREQLRRYLEQRRELGERELVLDGLSVEEALRIVGGARPRDTTTAAAAEARDVRQPVETPPDDWRAALRAAGAAPNKEADARRAQQRGIPASTPEVGGQLAPPGIMVGTTSRDLFGSGGPSLDSLDSLASAIATCTRCPLYATAK